MVKASIIIRCYNEEKLIGRLLDGILQQTEKRYEIIVVDSGSTDNTLNIVSRYPAKVLSIKAEDFSFGYALNFGCQKSEGEFIVLASAHVYPIHADWLDRLLSPFKDNKIAIVYGKQRGNSTTKYSEHQIFETWFPDNSNWNQKHPFCNNANAAVRRALWELIPYNEELTGLEDIDLAQKALSQGYRLAYAADAEIIHVHDESYKSIYNRYRREAIALKRILINEKFNFIDFIRLLFANILQDYKNAFFDKVFLRNISSIFKFRFMQFWGTYKGFSQRGHISEKLRKTFYYPKIKEKNFSDEFIAKTMRPMINYSDTEPGKKNE